MRHRLLLLCVAVAALAAGGQRAAADAPTDADALTRPRADLTPEQLAAYNAGKLLFVQKFPTLGPLYNDEACSNCHFLPGLGGSGDLAHAVNVAPEARTGDVEPFRKYAVGNAQIPTPPANVSKLVPPPLYGLGLIEQIPDETIRAHCGTGHTDPAKLMGSLPRNTVARFAFKPFVGTVADFVDGALFMECSVTGPLDKMKDDDAYPDPEVDIAFVESLAAFIRGLAPLPRNGNDPAGEKVFHSLGCATCHVPDMPPAMGVFSDFCVHGMGAALANGIIDHTAKGDEYRTTPLWGLRFKKIYLHDGRAQTVDAAIAAHEGEALAAATAYKKATPEERAALLRFLATL
jgi:CxxC motif-containing protein (DUF1111 family)